MKTLIFLLLVMIAVIAFGYGWVMNEQATMDRMSCLEMEQSMDNILDRGIGQLEHTASHYVAQCLRDLR